MGITSHPLWSVGFRPFFALACVAGASLPVVWAFVFAGWLPGPPTAVTVVQWHAHEMFYGFGWAVLGGFLLTATKSWVGIRGYHGSALVYLAAAWLLERAGMWFGGAWPPALFLVSNNLFLVSITAMLCWTLVRHRDTDSYRDNGFFLVVLPAFVVAKQLMLSPEHAPLGWSMAIGLFRMAFLVMLERTVAQFMRNTFQASILRDPRLDLGIKLLGVALILEAMMPAGLSAGLALLLAALLAVRFALWHPRLGMSRLDIGIMYLGYLAIVLQLIGVAVERVSAPGWVGTPTVHLFTFGAMGLIIPAMLVRISKGHTGRKPVFETGDKTVLRIMIAGLLIRVVAPQLAPGAYATWIWLSAGCWAACFGLLAWRYVPFLFRPRVDGKEH